MDGAIVHFYPGEYFMNMRIVGILGVLAASGAHADGWSGKGEAGFLLSRGNAESTSANAKIDLANEMGPWKNSVFFGGLYGKTGEFASAQRLEGRYQLDRKLTDKIFWFGALRAEQDKFSGFSYQASLATGLGYKFIDTDSTKLTGIAGVGYARLRPQQLIKDTAGAVIDRIKGDATGSAIATAGFNLEQKLTSNTKLIDKFLVETGSKNTSTMNDLSLQVAMSDAFALSAGYGVRYNTKPAAGSKKIDQLTTLNLVYNFK
jgi:putative salt-induced outer membrane protein